MIRKQIGRLHFLSGKSEQWGIEISYWDHEVTLMIVHWYFIISWIPKEFLED